MEILLPEPGILTKPTGKAGIMRDNFPSNVKSLLSRRAGFNCSNPNCRHKTDGPALGAVKALSIGEAAHICAASPGGPRYDDTMSPQKRSSYENGIWLCRNCAAMIDRDEKHYTVELLYQWKDQAEKNAWAELNGQEKREALADDEEITLYFMKQKQRIMLSRNDINRWLLDEEVHDYDFENARLLLSTIEDKDKIQLEKERFRSLLREVDNTAYQLAIMRHKRLASYTIREMWDEYNDADILLFEYLKEKGQKSLGARWQAEIEEASVKEWEEDNGLDNTISSQYGNALSGLIENEIVYESDWTSYGNAREYTLYNSAWKYIVSDEVGPILEKVKNEHTLLPF